VVESYVHFWQNTKQDIVRARGYINIIMKFTPLESQMPKVQIYQEVCQFKKWMYIESLKPSIYV
jgi:hypothetical protein